MKTRKKNMHIVLASIYTHPNYRIAESYESEDYINLYLLRVDPEDPRFTDPRYTGYLPEIAAGRHGVEAVLCWSSFYGDSEDNGAYVRALDRLLFDKAILILESSSDMHDHELAVERLNKRVN
jgi:hypothetical protein